MLSIPTQNLTSGAGGVGSFYTDEDVGALIVYLKSLPTADHKLPERRIEPMGKLMMAAGLFPPFAADQIDHASPAPAQPELGATVAYGEYLSHTCTECHGENLNGAPFGPPGEEILTPNLTPSGELAFWSEQQFITTIRTGRTPGGRQLKEDMPWKSDGQMTDDELKAIWLYLQSLPKREQAK